MENSNFRSCRRVFRVTADGDCASFQAGHTLILKLKAGTFLLLKPRTENFTTSFLQAVRMADPEKKKKTL